MTEEEYRFAADMAALMQAYGVRLIPVPDDTETGTLAFVGKGIRLDIPALAVECSAATVPQGCCKQCKQ